MDYNTLRLLHRHLRLGLTIVKPYLRCSGSAQGGDVDCNTLRLLHRHSRPGITHVQPYLMVIGFAQGGDVDYNTLRLLHQHSWLPGASEIFAGLHSGGFEAAQELVRSGKLDPQGLR